MVAESDHAHHFILIRGDNMTSKDEPLVLVIPQGGFQTIEEMMLCLRDVGAVHESNVISGMFLEDEEAFVPIREIFRYCRAPRSSLFDFNRVLRVGRPRKRQFLPGSSFLRILCVIAVSGVVCAWTINSHPSLWTASIVFTGQLTKQVVNSVIDWPVQFLYRNTPYIGWGGEDLEYICSRKTALSKWDTNFWKQNRALCEELYLEIVSKETLALKALWSGFLFIMLVVKFNISVRTAREQLRPELVALLNSLSWELMVIQDDRTNMIGGE